MSLPNSEDMFKSENAPGSSMKVSTRGRYALRIMLDIVENGDGTTPVSFKDVSKRQGISFRYMEQIGTALTRAGLLSSVRGAKGGYLLARGPGDIAVGEVLRATEGQLAPVPCLTSEEPCPRSGDCVTLILWERLNSAILDVVDGTTLQDLLDESRRRRGVEIDMGAGIRRDLQV